MRTTARRRHVRRCRALLARLNIPGRLAVEELCEHIAAGQGRPIVTSPMRLSAAGVSGLWLRGLEADYLCYEAETSRTHQTHIVLHELGHLVFRHHDAARGMETLFPGVSDATVRLMLSRIPRDCSGVREVEAETFAFVAAARIRDASDPAEESDVLDRIRRTLEA